MSVELDAEEAALLFGGPFTAKREHDGTIRTDLTPADYRGETSGDWVVCSELAGKRVAVAPAKAAALALRVMNRNVEDGLLVSDSLILDRRAEVLAEAAADCRSMELSGASIG